MWVCRAFFLQGSFDSADAVFGFHRVFETINFAGVDAVANQQSDDSDDTKSAQKHDQQNECV